jgi:hypothetical protein
MRYNAAVYLAILGVDQSDLARPISWLRVVVVQMPIREDGKLEDWTAVVASIVSPDEALEILEFVWIAGLALGSL